MRKIISVLGRPLRLGRGLLLRLASRAYRIATIEQIEVANLSTISAGDKVLTQRLTDTLALIDSYDHRRARRLARDIKRILVTDVNGAEFIPSINACMLSARYVINAPLEQLAATFVHEATHARLWSQGIGYPVKLRERIERRCVREEIAFAERLPNGADLIASAQERLLRAWWTEENELQRRVRQLEQLGRPLWYRRLYEWLWGLSRIE